MPQAIAVASRPSPLLSPPVPAQLLPAHEVTGWMVRERWADRLGNSRTLHDDASDTYQHGNRVHIYIGVSHLSFLCLSRVVYRVLVIPLLLPAFTPGRLSVVLKESA
jgi:hypothetical protein